MRPVVDLPQPDSPTRPSVSAARDREVDAVDRAHRGDLARDQDAAGDREMLGEALGLDQRRAGRGRAHGASAAADAGTR